MIAAILYGEGTPQSVKVKKGRQKKERIRCPSKKKLADMIKEAHALDAYADFDDQLSVNEILEEYGIDPKDPQTYKDEIIDFIDLEFMFGGFPGFEDGVFQIDGLLREYGIDPQGKIGQDILRTYIRHAQEEYYGDFYRYTSCSTCGREFKARLTLKYVHQILSDCISCTKCSRELYGKSG